MEPTMALEDVQLSPIGSDADDDDKPVVAGWLSVDGSVRPLCRGVNIIGRESEISDRNRERILQWQADHGGGGPVSVVLLRYASISSKHAIVYMEDHSYCFVEDMKSRNKTFVIHDSVSMNIPPGGRYGVRSGDTIKFGDVLCALQIGSAPVQAPAADVLDMDTQPLDPVLVQQPAANASLTATASVPSEEQPNTASLAPAGQQASGAAAQLPAAAPAAQHDQRPAPAAATTAGAAAAAAPAAASAAPHAGGSSRPSSRSSSRRTENLARPTLGFSSGDDVWDGTGDEPEATSQPAAGIPAAQATPAMPAAPAVTELQAGGAQDADAEVNAATAQPAGGSQHAHAAMPQSVQAASAAQPADSPGTAAQVADAGAGAALPSQPPAAAKESDSDVTRDIEPDVPPSASKPISSAGGGWRTKKHYRQSQGSDMAASTGHAAHGSQPADTAATTPVAAESPRGLGDGGVEDAAAAAATRNDVAAALDTEPADAGAAVTGDAANSAGAVQQHPNAQQPMQQPLEPEQQQQPGQQHVLASTVDHTPAEDAALAPEAPHGVDEAEPHASRPQQDARASVSQGVTGADVADALQMVGDLAAVFPTTQFQGLAPEETEDQDDDQAAPEGPAADAVQEGAPPTALGQGTGGAVSEAVVPSAAEPVQAAPAPKATPTAEPSGKPAARGERQWFEETPAALDDSGLPDSKPTSRRSSPEPTAAAAAGVDRPSGSGPRRPERRRKTKTPSPAADPDQQPQPARDAQLKGGAKRPGSSAKQQTRGKRATPAGAQQQPAGRPATRSSPAGSTAPPPSAETRATRSRPSKGTAAAKAAAASAAPSSSARKRKAAGAEQPAVRPTPAGPTGSTGKRAAKQQLAKSSPAEPAGEPPTSKASLLGPQGDKPTPTAQGRRQRKPSPTEQASAAPAAAATTRKRGRAVDHSKGVSSTPAEAAAVEAAAPAKKQKTEGKRTAVTSAAAAAAGAAADVAATTPAPSKSAVAKQGSARLTGSGAKASTGKAAAMARSSPTQQELRNSSRKAGGKTAIGVVKAAGASHPEGSPADAVKAGRRRAAAGSQIVVRFSKNVGEVLKKEATQKVVRLGGSVTEDDQGFTHFVCLSKRSGGSGFQKSLAALWALAKGVPIVTEMWVEASAAASAFVSPAAPGSTVMLLDKAAEKEHSFDLAVAYQRAQQKPLLADLHGQSIPVYLTPGLLRAEKDKGKGLKELITAAGGSIATTLPKDFAGRGGIVLGDETKVADEKRWGKSKAAAAARGMPVFGRSKLITAIMRQEFDRGSDELYTL